MGGREGGREGGKEGRKEGGRELCFVCARAHLCESARARVRACVRACVSYRHATGILYT